MLTRSHRLLAAITLFGALVALPAAAAPILPSSPALPPDDLVPVHGCHRSCEFGPALGWHRHGAACYPIACVPRAPYPGRCWIDWRGVRHCRW